MHIELVTDIQRRAPNPVPFRRRARGVRLRGDPIIVLHPDAEVQSLYGNRMINLFNKVRRAGGRGIPLRKLARAPWDRVLVRAMVRARAVRATEAAA